MVYGEEEESSQRADKMYLEGIGGEIRRTGSPGFETSLRTEILPNRS